MEDIKNNHKMISFQTFSHINFEKSRSWFVIIFLVLLVIAGLFVFLGQYLGAAALVVIGAVVTIYSKIPPKEISCTISQEGIKIDNDQYPYSELKSFWLAYSAPCPILYLEPASRFRFTISVPLFDQPIEPIKQILSVYLPEKTKSTLDIVDAIMTIFRF